MQTTKGTTIPTVSIVMPAFNAEATLERAVTSVLEQKYSNFELLIVDDKSSDATLDIAQEFKKRDPRVQVISNGVNSRRGPIEWEPRNDGLKHAMGKYIAYLDADNAWRPMFLQTLTAELDKRTELKLVYCDSCNHYSPRAKLSTTLLDNRRPSAQGSDWTVYSHKELDATALGTTQYIDTNEILHRTEIFRILNYLWATWHPNRDAISCAQGWIKPRRRHNDLELIQRILTAFGDTSVAHIKNTLVDFYYPSKDLECEVQENASGSLTIRRTSRPFFRFEFSSSLVTVTPLETTPARSFELVEAVERNKDRLRHICAEHGGVHFRGFEHLSVEEFRATARALGGELLSYKGGDAPRSELAPGIYTANDLPGDRSIPLHNEKAYSAKFPRHVLFYCAEQAEVGGETTLADSRNVLQGLSDELIYDFRHRRISYIQNMHNGKGSGKSWQETFETCDRLEVETYLSALGANWSWKSDGALNVCETVAPILRHPLTGEEVFFCQAHRWHISNFSFETQQIRLSQRDEFAQHRACRFGDGSKIPLRYLQEIRAVIRRQSSSFQLQRGEMVFLDNLITMHGRGEYQGGRLLYVAMTQG